MNLTKLIGFLVLLALVTPAMGQGTATVVDTASPVPYNTSSRDGIAVTELDVRNVSDIPYVWQQVNGLCHWSSLSMVMQYIGVSVDLSAMCAVAGIGFSAFYMQYEDEMMFYNGPMFRQMVPHTVLADIYGLNITLVLDGNNSEWGADFVVANEAMGVDYVLIDGWDQALGILKSTIDEGYPVEIMANPYYLPHPSYGFIRNLGLVETDSEHSVVVTGYDEQGECVYLADPGIGIMSEDYGEPLESEWCYSVNFTSLDAAWMRTYGMLIVKPGTGPANRMERQIGQYAISRLRGDRTSYIPGREDLYFVSLGADAFRALGYDLTGDALPEFFDGLGELTPHEKGMLLNYFGINLEQHMTLQSISFRAALQSLPEILPDFDLDAFVEAGSPAIEHFDVMTSNTSLNDIFYEGGESLLTQCFHNLAYQCENMTDGNLLEACEAVEDELSEIRAHLVAIADAWDSAANALESALSGSLPVPTIMAMGISLAMVVVVVVLIKRR